MQNLSAIFKFDCAFSEKEFSLGIAAAGQQLQEGKKGVGKEEGAGAATDAVGGVAQRASAREGAGDEVMKAGEG